MVEPFERVEFLDDIHLGQTTVGGALRFGLLRYEVGEESTGSGRYRPIRTFSDVNARFRLKQLSIPIKSHG